MSPRYLVYNFASTRYNVEYFQVDLQTTPPKNNSPHFPAARTGAYLFELVVMEDHSFLHPTVVRVRAFRMVVPPRCDSRSLS